MMQSDAYPQVEVSALSATSKAEKVVENITAYVNQYYIARGKRPPQITVTRKDYDALASQCASRSKLVFRGIPVIRGRS